MIQEEYRLVLRHYITEEIKQEDGRTKFERIEIDDPIIVSYTHDSRMGCVPVLVNHMLDEMKRYILNKLKDGGERR